MFIQFFGSVGWDNRVVFGEKWSADVYFGGFYSFRAWLGGIYSDRVMLGDIYITIQLTYKVKGYCLEGNQVQG